MNTQPKDGATARLIRAICVESLDGHKAVAHELELDGHTIAYVHPSGDDDWAGIIVQAVNEREALLAVAEAAKYTAENDGGGFMARERLKDALAKLREVQGR